MTVLAVGFLMTMGAARILHLTGPKAAGMYAGSLTSTPTLAAVRDRVKELTKALPPGAGAGACERTGGGVWVDISDWRDRRAAVVPDRAQSVAGAMKEGGRTPEIRIRDFVVENPGAVGRTLQEIMRHHKEPGFVISRIQRGDALPELPSDETVLQLGDLLAVVGGEEGLERAGLMFGAETESQIELDRTRLDNRRFLVSSRAVVGKKFGELKMPLDANVTRIRRGDVELIPTHDTRLEYGDSVRVVTERENFPAMSQFFGDSIRGTAEAQFGSAAIGLVLGVLARECFQIPIPGGQVLRLGLAGGPLLVAMVLGKIGAHGIDHMGDAGERESDVAADWVGTVPRRRWHECRIQLRGYGSHQRSAAAARGSGDHRGGACDRAGGRLQMAEDSVRLPDGTQLRYSDADGVRGVCRRGEPFG